MKLHDLVEKSYQTFLAQLKETKVVLLHPRSRYRSMLIARLINAPDLNVFYYALGPDDIKLRNFISGITHDLSSQYPTFGRHINMLPQNVYEAPEDHFDLVLDTFAQDIEEISTETFLLVLDEYDRSDSADDVQRFVERLAARVSDRCKIVLNSRTLPRLPWVSMISQKRAVLLEDETVIGSEFYGTLATKGGDTLEVYALGPGHVIMDEDPVDTWEGHLPRLLFFFALDRPIVTRSEICQAFWPELEPDQAVNVFHVTKRRLHKALNTDVLVHDEGYYRVNPDMSIYYDVMEFASALMEGRNTSDEEVRLAAYQRAAELYSGPFLHGHNDRWIQERRADFRAGYLEALTEQAHIWTQRERYEQALTLLQKAAAEDHTREDVHRDLMRLFARLGRRSEAAAHFQRVVDELRRDNIEPSQETHLAYQEIMG